FNSKPIDYKEGQTIYRKGKEKYEVAGKKQVTVYDRNTIFPRMHSSRGDHATFYKNWMQLSEGEIPTFIDNIGFFLSWQINQMSARKFLRKLSGGDKEMDGQCNSSLDGGWTSGFFEAGKNLPK